MCLFVWDHFRFWQLIWFGWFKQTHLLKTSLPRHWRLRNFLSQGRMEWRQKNKIPGVIPNSPGTFPEPVVRNLPRNLPGTRGSEAAPALPRNLNWQRPHSKSCWGTIDKWYFLSLHTGKRSKKCVPLLVATPFKGSNYTFLYRERSLEVPEQEACHYMKGSPQSSRPGKPCSSVLLVSVGSLVVSPQSGENY